MGLLPFTRRYPGLDAPGWRQVAPFGASENPGTGTGHLVITVATGLEPAVPHTVEIVPAFEDGTDQEVRLESICVAGGAATAEIIR